MKKIDQVAAAYAAESYMLSHMTAATPWPAAATHALVWNIAGPKGWAPTSKIEFFVSAADIEEKIERLDDEEHVDNVLYTVAYQAWEWDWGPQSYKQLNKNLHGLMPTAAENQSLL